MSTPSNVRSDASCEPIYIARQAIFDASGHIWGYELLFRHSGESTSAYIADPDVATAKVIADGFALAMRAGDIGRHALINFPANLLLRDAAFALPSQHCVIEILETVPPTPEILEACHRLKENGYRLALDDFIGQPGYEALIDLADIVKVDLLALEAGTLQSLARRLQQSGCRLLAEKVEDQRMFDLTKSLGFDFFQGYYFSRPQLIKGKKIPAGQMAKIRLLQELSKPEFEFAKVAAIIRQDQGLCFRLLNYINSAYFSLRSKVNAVTQALTLMGLVHVKQWLQAVLLAEFDQSPRGSELTRRSLHRARYLELLVQGMTRPPFSADIVFLLGLFSLLDALLNQPMDEIINPLPLDDMFKDALLGQYNPAREWVDHALAAETGAWDAAEAFLRYHNLPLAQSAVKHVRAGQWACEMIGSASG